MGPEHPSVGKALRHLAELYEEKENFVEANRLYKWGIDVSGHALGKEHPDVAELMTQYTALLKKMGEHITVDEPDA
jgi:hypothetical protein